MQPKNFTILGERSSGTEILKQFILDNFDIPYTQEFGSTHFFGFYDYNYIFTEETMFICIVRDPVDWINAFYQNPQYIPIQNQSLDNFLEKPFYSIWSNVIGENIISDKESNQSTIESIIHEDRNIITHQPYKNIFELRKVKTEYLTETLPALVKHHELIRYEDLLENPQLILEKIQQKYGFAAKQFTSTKQVQPNTQVSPVSDETIQYIKSKLDLDQENNLGY